MEKDRPEILVIPPLAFAVALLMAILLNRWWPLGFPFAPPRWPAIILGLLVMGFAIFTNVSGFLSFRRAGTHVNPTKPALSVVRDGVFRYTRNPMYLGMIFFVFGLGLFMSNAWAFILALALWVLLHFGVVLPEERYLTEKFGQTYLALLRETRRWL